MRFVSISHLSIVLAGLMACNEGSRAVDAANGRSGKSKSTSSSTENDAGAGGIAAFTDEAMGGATDAMGPTDSGGSNADGIAFPNCTVVPINPNATQQAKNLLCYIYTLSGQFVLSGQQETSWNSDPSEDVEWIKEQTGYYPAILGGDYLYANGTTARAKAWWRAGGVPLIRYHMGAPPLSDTYDNSKASTNIDAVIAEGTSENASFRAKLDYVAKQLMELQNANVPVLWAPLHEAQLNGWFWWSKGSGDQYVSVWRYTYDYLTNVKGLNNLVWLTPFSNNPSAAFYPGKAYADLAGPDTYDKDPPFTSLYTRVGRILGVETPIPLHETGSIPNPDAMFPTNAPWVLFNVWAQFEVNSDVNTVDQIKAAYASRYTITRDEVPNLK